MLVNKNNLKGLSFPLRSLGHAFFINARAIFFGLIISYGFWYTAHHASQFVYVLLILLIVILLGTIWTSKISLEKLYRANYIILPVILFISAMFFFLLLINPTYQILFVILIGLIYFHLFRSLPDIKEKPTPEKKKSFTQSLDIVLLLTSFFCYATLQELMLFFEWKSYWIILLGVAISFVLLYQNYWYHRVMTFRALFYILLGTLIMGEMLWAFTFLPTGYLTNAALTVAIFYIYQAISLAALKNQISRQVVMETLLITSVIIVIILTSSSWTPLI